MARSCPAVSVSYQMDEDENQSFQESIQMGVEHWEDEIDFLQARLRGEQGDIDNEDREACQEALQIAKGNLEGALGRRP